jgi:hypothetical protein
MNKLQDLSVIGHVSNVRWRSMRLALRPLNIKFSLPHKGRCDHPELLGFGDGRERFFVNKEGKQDPTPFTGVHG